MFQVGTTNHQSCDCVCVRVCIRRSGRTSLTSAARDYPSCCGTSSSSRRWCTLWRSRGASPSKTSQSPARWAVAPPSRPCCLSASPPPQVRLSLVADSSAPQQVVVPDGRDGGPAEGPDAEQERSAQTVAAAHRVHCGKAPEQLDVHLPLRLPPGKSPSLELTVGQHRCVHSGAEGSELLAALLIPTSGSIVEEDK